MNLELVMAEVMKEFQMTGLADGIYGDFVREVVKRMMPWQPIETAPKDRRILGCTWHPELSHLYAPKMIVWAAYHPNSKGKECWRDAEICGNKMERVTHWMPLPEAPNVEGNAPGAAHGSPNE